MSSDASLINQNETDSTKRWQNKIKQKPENEQQWTEIHQSGSLSKSFYKFYEKPTC